MACWGGEVVRAVCGEGCCWSSGCVGVGGGSGNLEGGGCGPRGAEAHRWSTELGEGNGAGVLPVVVDCVQGGSDGQGGEGASVTRVVTCCVGASGAGEGVT